MPTGRWSSAVPLEMSALNSVLLKKDNLDYDHHSSCWFSAIDSEHLILSHHGQTWADPRCERVGTDHPGISSRCCFFCEFLVGNKKTRESLQAGFPQRSGGNWKGKRKRMLKGRSQKIKGRPRNTKPIVWFMKFLWPWGHCPQDRVDTWQKTLNLLKCVFNSIRFISVKCCDVKRHRINKTFCIAQIKEGGCLFGCRTN